MKKYFAHLRPMERRLAIAVIVVVILVLNYWKVWPHFSDWKKLSGRLTAATTKLEQYQKTITQTPQLQQQVKQIENQGDVVPPEDQAINFLRLIQSQAVQSGVGIVNASRAITRTNDVFFIEQVQNMNLLATDDQLVDFLYKLGSGNSMIRVRGLELQADPAHQHLNAQVQLVASYQKNAPELAAAAAPAAAKPSGAPTPSAKPGSSLTPVNAKTNSTKSATKVSK